MNECQSVSSVNGSCVMSQPGYTFWPLFCFLLCRVFCLLLFSLYFYFPGFLVFFAQTRNKINRNVKKSSKAIKPNKKTDSIGLYNLRKENVDSSEKLACNLIFICFFSSCCDIYYMNIIYIIYINIYINICIYIYNIYIYIYKYIYIHI